MKVGIYIGAETPQAGGSFSFVRAVLEGLCTLETRHDLRILYAGAEPPNLSGGLKATRVAERRVRPIRIVANRFRNAARRHEAWQNEIRSELDGLGLHLIWSLTPAAPPTNVPYAVTVWDLAHRLEPSFPEVRVTGWTWDSRERHYQEVLPQASYVIVGAPAARDDVSRCYGVSPERVRVLPLVTPAARASAGARGAAQPPYIFYPAQFWPHKNHAALLLAMKQLRDAHKLDYRLVLTGSDKGNLGHVRTMVAELGLASSVTFAGFVSDEALDNLYRDAFALVFPSFFGPDNLPPLEAMQRGCPVIAATVRGADHQLGDAAILVDQRSPDAIASAVARLHKDPALRAALIERGLERVKRWSPVHYGQAMLSVMDEFEAERRCWSYTSPYVHS